MATKVRNTVFVSVNTPILHASECYTIKPGEVVELFDIDPIKPFVKRRFWLRDQNNLFYTVTKNQLAV